MRASAQKPDRTLTAIVFTDVANFTSRVAEEEARVLRLVKRDLAVTVPELNQLRQQAAPMADNLRQRLRRRNLPRPRQIGAPLALFAQT